jgi:hypothetical protein
MSGLKINYRESEVVTFGVDDETELGIEKVLNCSVGKLPIKYLGFPINSKRLGVNAFRSVVEKDETSASTMEGKTLDFKGGGLILTNTSLSSLPIYWMGMFLLHEETHHQMDTVRSKFFWGSDEEKFKYHMIQWENTCLPKYFGGAGIINTRVLNEALVLKWVWRLHNADQEDICCELLRNKYLRNKNLTTCNGKGGSHFWQGLCKVKHKIKWGGGAAGSE